MVEQVASRMVLYVQVEQVESERVDYVQFDYVMEFE